MGKIITVCGGGGYGKTTIAANLASVLSQKYLVGLLSTNTMYGGIQHLFGVEIEHSRGLSEMLHTKGDISNSFVPCGNNKNLCLLSLANSYDCLMLAGKEYDVETNDIKEILSELKNMFQYIVIDCEPELCHPLSVYSLIYADSVLNIIKPTVQGMAFYNSYRALLAALNINDEKMVHIMNNDKGYIGAKNIEKTAGIKISMQIPYCKSVEEAENNGEPACSGKNGLFYAKIKSIAEKITECDTND